MPCYDSGAYDREDQYRQKKKIVFLEAALCAALTVFEKIANENTNVVINPFSWIDYEKAGIGEKKLKDWWDNHKREDYARRKKEKEKQDLKASALSKLTEEERKVLGL